MCGLNVSVCVLTRKTPDSKSVYPIFLFSEVQKMFIHFSYLIIFQVSQMLLYKILHVLYIHGGLCTSSPDTMNKCKCNIK